MAKLSGIDVYKQLPRTNCRDCGLPTCMAFAMQVASQKVPIDGCPHVSDEARVALGAAQTPPMATLEFGPHGRRLGGETVLHRHESRFVHPPILALRISDRLAPDAVDRRVESAQALQFERVGQTLGVDGLAIVAESESPERFAQTVDRIASGTDLPLILLSENPECLTAAAAGNASRRPLIGPATESTLDRMASIAKDLALPLILRTPSAQAMAILSRRALDAGVKELVLDPAAGGPSEAVNRCAELRSLALSGNIRALGFPTLVEMRGDAEAVALDAIGSVARYGDIIVIEPDDAWAILPIITARMNLFTDPQVPNAVEAKLYEIGSPGRDAPVLVTTNFALTYFTVAGEVENSKVSAWICVMDTEGLGVLNAYADRQLTAESLVEAIRAQGAMDRVDHSTLIIPGLIARLRMAIQEVSGWDVLVGPEDAGGIPRFLNTIWPERMARP